MIRLESLLCLIEELISSSNSVDHDIFLSLQRQVDAKIHLFDDDHQPCAISAV